MSTFVQLTVTASSGAPVMSFRAPLVLHVSATRADEVPAFSADGITWAAIPRRSGATLGVAQQEGYSANVDGSIDISTRHTGYFGMLKDVGAPTAPALTGRLDGRTLRLNWRGAPATTSG